MSVVPHTASTDVLIIFVHVFHSVKDHEKHSELNNYGRLTDKNVSLWSCAYICGSEYISYYVTGSVSDP